jgi:hypothetical protein
MAKELAALREKCAELFGEATTTGNQTWLIRRIAWRIQAKNLSPLRG